MRTVDLEALLKTDALVGRELARQHLPILVSNALASQNLETILWDWSRIDVVTASYLAGTFVPLIRMATSGKLKLYSMFVGLNKQCEEELDFVLSAEKLAALVAPSPSHLDSVAVVGHLDAAYRQALGEVLKRRRASARALHQRHASKARIGQTAWVKRLTTLESLGLVRRRRVGREYVYEATYT